MLGYIISIIVSIVTIALTAVLNLGAYMLSKLAGNTASVVTAADTSRAIVKANAKTVAPTFVKWGEAMFWKVKTI